MKITNIFALIASLILALPLSACARTPVQGSTSAPSSPADGASLSSVQSTSSAQPESSAPPAAQIYLYGEQHGVKKILDGELELWYKYYHDEKMRHLFVEYPYYTAEFLNLWMKTDSDEIIDALYNDWEGSLSHNPDIKEFLKQIKIKCPETVFHGTDVGHQYETTGERFLQALRDNKQEKSEQYKRAQANIEQGKYYYDHSDGAYRENKMAENFIYEFDKLSGTSVMGIYGSAHIWLEAADATQTVACMATQLKKRYGDSIHSEDLSGLAKIIEPEKVAVIAVGEKEYKASYFGKEDLTGFRDFAYREFWRLENAYNDFRDMPEAGDSLPNNNYPMQIETGQVFVIDYAKTDGSVERLYYRSDGNLWEGRPTTEAFNPVTQKKLNFYR